jgi:hypothetical protein
MTAISRLTPGAPVEGVVYLVSGRWERAVCIGDVPGPCRPPWRALRRPPRRPAQGAQASGRPVAPEQSP